MFLVELEQALFRFGLVLMLLLRLRLKAKVVELFLLALVVILDQGNDINEVRMVGVDVAELNFDEIFDHFFCFVEGFQE